MSDSPGLSAKAQTPLLQARDLTVAFGDRRVVEGLNLTVQRGEIVGLLGESGSGKSTAAYALLGLVKPPGKITGGQVLFEGEDLLAMSPEALRMARGGGIGLIVQNPRAALHPMLNVGQQIAEVWRAHNKGSSADARRRALEMLKLVGINDPERRLNAYAHELSGGMAQRVLIAMALSSSPRLLVADEPTSGLDVTIQAQVLDEMWRTVRRTGSSVLLVTQEDGIIANYCDRVVTLENGRVTDDQPTRVFFSAGSRSQAHGGIAAAASTAEQSAGGEPLLQVSGLTKHFPIPNTTKRVHAVSDVDLTIRPGETLGLVGESGSGKSTVGRSLIRLIGIEAGTILFKGKDMSRLGRKELKQLRVKMQIVLQDPYDSVDLRWSVAQILAEPLDVHTSLSGAAKRARIEKLLALVELPREVLDQRPRALGSGALQRVNIARALATDPEFIVLDEPTSVLAPSARNSLIALLRRLQHELGLSFLFISHDLTTVSQVCDRVAVMYLSQIVETGPTDAIFTRPRHPYTKALIASHLSPDAENRRVDREDEAALAGEIPSPIDLPVGCYLYSRCPNRLERCAGEPQRLEQQDDGRLVRCWRAPDLADIVAAHPEPEAVHA